MSHLNRSIKGQEGSGGESHGLARRLGLFDATMIVMGGIVGSGIFINPYVVARQVHTPFLILGAWLAGGCVALAGAFVYAELAACRPEVGGQYAYLRDAFHPSVAFLYGWALLLVIQTGGMAAVAVTFARYFAELTRVALPDWTIAALTLALLTVVNCLGVRSGSNVQSILMVLKILAITALILCGVFAVAEPQPLVQAALLDRPVSLGLLAGLGAAMTPVMFAYGGWQTASFVAGEMREPRRDLPRGLLIGVCGVILLYTLVNLASLRALGAEGLAATTTPASAVMRLAFGPRGAALIAVGIAISTLGFLSQSMLTAPRVYFAMAEDALFFKAVARLDRRTRAPIVAIALQGLLAAVIAVSGRYEQILNYVVSVDFIWFGLTALSLFVFRRRRRAAAGSSVEVTGEEGAPPGDAREGFRVPGHPFTTALFAAACALIVAATVYQYPANSAVGLAIVVSGIPVYFLWRGRRP
ncbi:MAG: basic amino acid/polyamine antiporter, family [Acidobacteriota bacterium]|jgi:APA family basic amino acid/polyamine antiporter|nr:basic amino acid/polyamine antiporter, family [Acidobacteriota bacterium]